MPNLQFIWDPDTISKCIKIPEEAITLEQVRNSSGLEIDRETGLRTYFVLAQ